MNQPTKYELLEVLHSITNRAFLNKFAQKRGVFITSASKEALAEEISCLYLDNDDLEEIRKEAYQLHSNHALSGFMVKSKNRLFNLKDVYEGIFSEGSQKKGQVLSNIMKVSGDTETYKANIRYEKKRPGRIEFLQDEVNTFDFYIKNHGNGIWQVEIDSNRSTDIKELKDLFNVGLRSDAEIDEINSKLLTTELSISFFDRLAKESMGSDWKFYDIKQLTLKRGSDDEGDGESDISEDELVGITQAILQGKNLRDNTFVKQCVESGYRFNAMTYEFEHKTLPNFLNIKAEFKIRPKVFEVSIVNFQEIVGYPQTRQNASLSDKDHRLIRSNFWNSSKKLYDALIGNK